MNDSEFTSEELALLNEAEAATNAEAQGLPADDTGDADDDTQQAADQASEQGEGQPAADTDTQVEVKPEPQPSTERPAGDLRVALRASRRAEDRTRRENERLRQELEAVKAGQKDATPQADVSDEVLQELEADFPQVAKVVKTLSKQVQELSKVATAAKPEDIDPEFVPPSMPPDIQDAVDEVPDLLAWQLNPDQTNFELAKQADTLLRQSPKWAGKPMSERFTEAVRLVKDQIGEPVVAPVVSPKKPEKTADDARRVIESTARTTPVGIGDLRGGSAPSKQEPDFRRMSDDQILASLPR